MNTIDPPIAVTDIPLFSRCGDGYQPVRFDELMNAARSAIAERFKPGVSLSSPALVKNYLRLTLAPLEHERLMMLALDTQNQLISSVEIGRGSLNSASVFPREVVKLALGLNCAAVIFAHNHPSGNPEPSGADRQMTQRLADALALVDVRTLDHLVVGGDEIVSFAQRGWV